ncbi:uncharacterized protein UMAG_01916 [Mycosarcoma maydis]|uniref:Methyltransferase domain-containing protein n=1 Tax=Mycosarcoma maydis TaxID=5270 RepID=A0A0D1CC37_MYCMD|nr:uncharacterized protein UMAG_01916 [Ustilago maydis 521]KIS70762.1 hypothetical protein UMAG_01916 [Ustilago maydis 521]|eukprot:XP_011387841.1 hypothetical protein UMAG_01916 [Ustilago maydis 521]
MTCSAQARSAAASGLSYHTSTYWDHRFSTDPRERHGFEWLSSSTWLLSLLTVSPTPLLLRDPPIRILHIGAGTSRLSLDILAYWRDHFPDEWKDRASNILNVDFSPNSIDFQKRAEMQWLQEVGETRSECMMKYLVLDLLDWQQVDNLFKEGRQFDVVLDKSTTDSISTGDDTLFSSISKGLHHRALSQLAEQHSQVKHGVATIQVLGIHLASLVKLGGVWLCHSYSSDRWEDVVHSQGEHATSTWPWTQLDKMAVPVQASDPNAPQINHYIYTMRRT